MSGMHPSWSAVLATLLIACATMLQNDWRDRGHDRKKGKTLALRHPRAFLTLVTAIWSIAVLVTILATREHGPIGYMLFGAIVVGLVYSETRTIPVVPILLVATTSASPALMAALAGAEQNKLWLLFLASALVVFGREVIKDLDDSHIDGGYKWTIPRAAGERRAKHIATAAIASGSMIAPAIALVALPGVVLALAGAFLLIRHNERRTAKHCIDIGMALAITALGIRG